jgi:outer membrane protein OmpA-like peptidoglycan-associated protein
VPNILLALRGLTNNRAGVFLKVWNPMFNGISAAMIKRNLLLILAAMAISAQVFAQPFGDSKFKQKFKDADGLAFDGAYEEAIVLYKDMYAHDSSNANINHGIGLCHLGLGQYRSAITFLETATRNVALDYQEANWKEKRAPGKTYYYLASAYHKVGDYDKAVGNYFNYRSFIDMDDYEVYNDVKRQIEYAETGKELSENPVKVKINKLPPGINSRYEDFCPVLSADGQTLIFTSRRETGTGDDLTGTGEYFDDIFVCKKVGDTWSKPTSIGTNINTADHEAAIGLSPDGQTLYIYKDMDIYFSVLQGSQWSTPKKVGSDVNSSSWETHATVSADENLLVFTSDRPGGRGERDLYYTRKLPNGEWSLSQNMGDSINTPYAEESPFLTVDGKFLIFSSEGHRSMGGFDLFRSELVDGVWGSPKNIGYPINSPMNDMFFVTTPDGRYAYYSSVRSIGMGEQDIYLLKLEETKAASVTILAGKMTVPAMAYSDLGAKITVREVGTESIVGEYRPNRETGRYILILDPGEDYEVTYHADGYASKEVLVDVPDNSTYYEINKTIELDEVVFGDEILALQAKKRQEELARLAALAKKAEEDSLAIVAAANSALNSDLLAQQEADALERQEVEDQFAMEAQSAEQLRKAAEAEAANAERKRIEREQIDQLAADTQTARIEASKQKPSEKAAQDLAAKQAEGEGQKLQEEQLAEQEAQEKQRQQILAAQQAEVAKKNEAELDAKNAADDRIAQEQAAAKLEADKKAEMARSAELAKQLEEESRAGELASSQEPVKTEGTEEIVDPVAKKRAELLARIEKLKAAKQGVGYDTPAEPVAQQTKPVAKQQEIKKAPIKLPPKQEVAQVTKEPVKQNPIQSIQAESLSSSEIKDKKANALARIARLKTEKKGIDKSTEEESLVATKAESDIKEADEELANLDERRRKVLNRKNKAEQSLSEAEEAKSSLLAQGASNNQERSQLESQVKQLDSQFENLESDRLKEEKAARLESDRLEELSRQEESARQSEIASAAERKKQEAKAEAARKAEEEKSRNNSAGNINELRIMNEQVINENKDLRDQFAEVNRKLDIIMNNMGVSGKSTSRAVKPQPREAVFSAEELKSGKNFVLKNIFFDYNQASLKPTSKKELNKLYYFLKDNSGVSIVVEGHTDSKGDNGYNMRLSQTRAESVLRYLTNMGISKSRLRAVGYGEQRPIAINENPDGTDNPSGRALNRRIEIGLPTGKTEKMEVEKINIPKGLQIGS